MIQDLFSEWSTIDMSCLPNASTFKSYNKNVLGNDNRLTALSTFMGAEPLCKFQQFFCCAIAICIEIKEIKNRIDFFMVHDVFVNHKTILVSKNKHENYNRNQLYFSSFLL